MSSVRLGAMLLAFTSCDPGAVRLTCDRASYAAADSVTLTLDNRTGASIGYNLCLASLRSAAGATVDDRDRPFCEAIQRVLPPGASVTAGPRPLPKGIAPERYFFTTSIEGPSGQLEVIESTRFDVVP